MQLFDHGVRQRRPDVRHDVLKGVEGHAIILPGFIFPLERQLRRLVKQIFDVGRRIPGCQRDDFIDVDFSRVEL